MLAGFFVVAHLDNIAGSHFIRRNVNFLTVNGYGAVADKLPGLMARSGKTQTENQVVQTQFQKLQKARAGYAALLGRAQVNAAKLPLQYAVNEFGLLLFAKLLAVFGNATAPLPMNTRLIRPAHNGTLGGFA